MNLTAKTRNGHRETAIASRFSSLFTFRKGFNATIIGFSIMITTQDKPVFFATCKARLKLAFPTVFFNQTMPLLRTLSLFLLLSIVSQSSLLAEDVTWNGNQNNNWRNNSNWSGGGDPGSSDTAIFPDGEGRNAIDLRDSNDADVNRSIFAIELHTDGTDTTSETSPASNWYFRGGVISVGWFYWSHTNNQSIIVNGVFNVADSSEIKLRGFSGRSTDLYFHGDFTGSGDLNYNSLSDDDDLYFYTAQSLSGTVWASGGGLYLRHDNALANATLDLTDDGFLNFEGYDPHVGALSGDIPVVLHAGRTLSVGGNNTSTDYSGAFSGSGKLTKEGGGTWRLNSTAAHTHSGETTVSSGELIIDGAGSLENSAVNVESGADLTLFVATSLGNLIGSGTVNVISDLTIAGKTYVTPTFSGTLKGAKQITITDGFERTITGSSGNFSGNLNLAGGVTTIGATRFENSWVDVSADNALKLAADTSIKAITGSGDIHLSHNLTFGATNASMDGTRTGDFTGTGTLTKLGTGTWTHEVAKTGTGDNIIADGTLAGGGSLSGHTIIASGARIHPNGGSGTLKTFTCNDDLTINGIARLKIETTDDQDKIIVGGNLDVSTGALSLNTGGVDYAGETKVLFTYGSLTGTFQSFINFPSAGYYIDYAYDDGSTSTNIAIVKDAVAPTLNSITRQASYANPTNSNTIEFDIEFSENVTGVDAGDFNTNYAGTTGTATLTGSGSSYVLTIPSISGNGALTINLPTGSEIADQANNPIASSSINESIIIDNLAPTVAGIATSESTPSNADSIEYTVTFSESVMNFDAFADLTITTTGSANVTGASISGTGDTFTVTLTGVSGDGSLALAINTASDVQDTATNALASGITSSAITIDNTAPEVTIFTTSLASSTNANSIVYTVSFSEPVTTFDSGLDLTLLAGNQATLPHNLDDTLTDTEVDIVDSGDQKTYTVTLNSISGDGALTFRILRNNISDRAGNIMQSLANTFSPLIQIDNTAPDIETFTMDAPTSPATTNTNSITYQIKFTEPVFGLDGGDDLFKTVDSEATVDLTAATVTNPSGDDINYVVLIPGIEGNGSFRFRPLLANVTDAASNPLADSGSIRSPRVEIDNTAPIITRTGDASITLVVGDAWSDLGATATDNIDASVSVTPGGDTVDTNSPGTYMITYNASDAAGNVATEVTRSVTVITAFASWAANNGLTGNDALATADPDKDGRYNLEEFAFDGDPNSATNDGKSRTAFVNILSADYITLTLAIRDGASFSGAQSQTASIDGIDYEIRGSNDLSSWIAVIAEVTPSPDSGLPALNSGWSYHSFRYTTSLANADNAFLQALVTEAP